MVGVFGLITKANTQKRHAGILARLWTDYATFRHSAIIRQVATFWYIAAMMGSVRIGSQSYWKRSLL